jgi:hypothetical protein
MVSGGGLLGGCGAAPTLPPAPPPPPVAVAPTTRPAPRPEPSLSVRIHPVREPSPLVHTTIDLDPPMGDAEPLRTWRLAAGQVARLSTAVASDPDGTISVELRAEDGGGVTLSLSRAPAGHVRVEYDVLAPEEQADAALGVLVRGGRFRGSGEALVALPPSIESVRMPISVTIDGASLEADKAASSFGVGATRKLAARPLSLRYAVFVAGAQGDMVSDTLDGHDEASWMGFAGFDLRGAVVELAEVRSALATILGAHEMLPDVPWTYLFEVASTRPSRAFTVTARFQSALMQLGSTEPWGTPVRLTFGQLLARRWIGDAIRFTDTGHPAELAWFDEGVALYLGTTVLARLALLSTKDLADTLDQQLASLATSAYAGVDSTTVAARAASDPAAHVALVMRGALYAARESAIIRERTKGERGFESVLATLLARARGTKSGPITALPLSAWSEAILHEDPAGLSSFDAIVVHGAPVVLPIHALGPCFRAGTGEYVAFDAGFDLEATRRLPAGAERRAAKLRADGPAARAGLLATDVVTSIDASEGDASVPVVVNVQRSGKKVRISYAPRGARGRGQTWSRIAGVPDDKCGAPL